MKIKGANWKRLLSVLLACVMLLANVGLAEEMPAAEEMPVVEVEAQPAEQEPAVEEPAAPAPEPEPVKEEATAAPEKEPEEMKAPEVSEGPTAEPEATEEPQPSEETEDEPEATEEPAVTDEPEETEEPAAAEEAEELSVQFWTDMRYAVAGTEAMRFQLRVAGGAAPYRAEIVVLCNGSEVERNTLDVSEAEEIAVMPQNAGSYTVQVTVSDANGNTAFAQVELPVSGTETESDWTADFRGVRLSGDFAADLIAIAKTQLGYQESEKNFVIDGNGQKKGYTRYGDWYGSAYADWNALFVSFCASYAKVSGFPTAASAAALKQALGNAYKTGSYAPKAGDLVFLNNPERVAVIASVDGKTIRAIEGDVNGSVANTQYTVGSSEIAGYMAMDVLKQRAGLAVAEDEEPADEENTTVAVNSALTVTAQPTDAKVAENATAYFTVKASGTGLTYQWQFSTEGKTWSNTKVTGYNTATLSVQALSYRNNYYYRCVITDAQGNSVTTNGAKLTIGETSAIVITEQPKDAMVAENATAYFTVKASGTGLTYQWQFSTEGKTWSNTKVTGYNTATLSVQALSYRNNYYYRCVIKDAQGNSVTTNGAKLTIGEASAIVITEQPKDAMVAENATASFTVKASGTGLTYQWQFSTEGKTWSNTKVTGYNTATLSVQALSYRNNYYYRCVIKDAQGNSVTTNGAKLTIGEASAIVITEQPKDAMVAENATAYFTVKASGTGLTYQWQFSTEGKTWSNTKVTGYNTATLSVQALSYRNNYYYRCVIKDAQGNSVTTNGAKLTIGEAAEIRITTQPADATVKENEEALFTVKAEGTGLSYQWQFSTNGTNWSNTKVTGYNTDTLKVQALSYRNNYYYRCVIKDAQGNSATSEAGQLLIQSDIVIDDVLYKEIDGGMEVAKYNGSSASLTIPETVNGKTVIRIGASAFEGNTTLTSINLPDTVQVIGERAFANCTNLSEMN